MKINNSIIKKVFKKIKEYPKIVIARHVGPDPDAIASTIALRDSIRLTFPEKMVSAVGLGVSKFKYYGVLDKIEPDNYEGCLLIVLDVPNISRVDGIDGLKYKEIMKIDHHPAEDIKGPVDWTDETSCSTCQMIAELILKTPLKLDTKIAGNLYLGIVSDSDRFLLSYTSVDTFQIVTDLIRRTNLPFVSLYEKLYERPIEEIRFHGYIATHLTVTENGFAYIEISDEILKEYHVDSATPSNMINDFNFIKDVYVWCFVTHDVKNEVYKVNIRSKGPVINEVAMKYHGGGHKMASGVRTPNKEDIEGLLQDLDETCKKYKESREK